MKSFLLTLLFSTTVLAQNFVSDKFSPELEQLLNSSAGSLILKSAEEKYPVIIYTDEKQGLKSSGLKIFSDYPGFITSALTLDEIKKLSSEKTVKYITSGELNYIHNDSAVAAIGADRLHSGLINDKGYKGNGVIICIIDTGIDWTHPDFRDPIENTKTRILAIWDQTLTPVNGENSPAAFSYGVEYSKTDIDNELDGSPAGFVREADFNGHGTHIAGTAAGNSLSGKFAGIAPEADLLVVKAGNGSFTSANIINALAWAAEKARELDKPIVVNMSLGSDAGAHDGTDAKSAAINYFTGPGRAVVLSAGNSGGSKIHISGVIAPRDSATLLLNIPAYNANAGTGNDNLNLDTWLEDNTDVSIVVATPHSFNAPQSTGGQSTKNTIDGTIYIYNFVMNQNNDREIYLGIYDCDASRTPAPGLWVITLHNNSDKTVKYHSWLYDSSIGNNTAYLEQGDNNYTLGNTASEAIITGSYVDRSNWTALNGNSYWCVASNRTDDISVFSAKGPTRNDNMKPDITAPGQAIISCRSGKANYNENKIISDLYVINQGTSMSAAVVSGAVALLLEQNRNLTSAEIKNLLTSSADRDQHTGNLLPDYTWGFGKLNIEKAMVSQLEQSTISNVEITNENEFRLDQNYPNPFNPTTNIKYHITEDCNVSLKVFDVLGKDVVQMESGFKRAGSYTIEFNGYNLPSGVYFYQLQAGKYTAVRKLILQK